MYIILEIQKYNSGRTDIVAPVLFPETAEGKKQAEQKYYTVLSYAAVSSVDVHTCVLMNDYGETIEKKTIYHGASET